MINTKTETSKWNDLEEMHQIEKSDIDTHYSDDEQFSNICILLEVTNDQELGVF